jgi:hypothetical protein
MALQAKAPTETASQLFAAQVQRLPGVLRVDRTDDLTGKEAFRVYVRTGDREARYAVYRLEADTYKRFEGVSLDIHVVEEAASGEVSSGSPAAG